MRAWIALLLLLVGLVASVADRFPALPLVSQRPPVSSASTLNTSLISYWKLDEASGTRVDSEPTGTPQDLTDNNTVNQTNGVIGSAAWIINSNGEYLSRSTSSDLDTSGGSFSVWAWIYLNSTNADRYVLSKTDAGTGDEFGLYVTVARPGFWIATNTTYVIATNSAGLDLKTWYFVAGVFNASSATVGISLNGGAIQTVSSAILPDTGGSPFRIGAYRVAATPRFDGFIDEVGFSKKAISASEISELYNSGAGKTCCPF